MSVKNPVLEKNVFEIGDRGLNWLKDKLGELNKKAKKLGCELVGMEIVNEFESEVNKGDDIHPIIMKVKIYHVKVFGETPKYNGWKFVGRLENYENENGIINIFHTVPDEKIPEKYRSSPIICDHCKIRRYRKYSYVVEHEETGETLRVGSSCLKDFLGHNNPNELVRIAEFLKKTIDEISEGIDEFHPGKGISKHEMMFNLEEVIAISTKMINHYGWVSRSEIRKAEEWEDYSKMATADRVDSYLFPPKRGSKEWECDTLDRNPPTEEDLKFAKDVRKWVRYEMERDEENEFLNNLNAISRLKEIKLKDLGLTCYLPVHYKKHLNILEEKERDMKSEWIGSPKERMTRKMKVISRWETEGFYGLTIIYRFRDEDGNIFVWFCSNGMALDREEENYFTFTIKDHNVYKDVKNTVVNRLRIAKEKEIKKAKEDL